VSLQSRHMHFSLYSCLFFHFSSSFNNLYLTFMLDGNVGAVRECAKKFMEHKKSTFFTLFSDTVHAFILGLAAFQISRESQENEAPQWLKIGRKCTSDMKLWAEQGCAWNFQHRVSVVNNHRVITFTTLQELTQ
jgi:hypothetical protein